MPHFKPGWAVMECTYESVFTEIYENRYRPVPHELPIHKFETQQRKQISRQTYYARCKTGKTGDDHLSRWLREVARPEADRVVKKDIEKAEQVSSKRVKQWEEDLMKGWIKPNSPRPSEYRYEPLDAGKLVVQKIYCSPVEPDEGHGKLIGWCPSTETGKD